MGVLAFEFTDAYNVRHKRASSGISHILKFVSREEELEEGGKEEEEEEEEPPHTPEREREEKRGAIKASLLLKIHTTKKQRIGNKNQPNLALF